MGLRAITYGLDFEDITSIANFYTACTIFQGMNWKSYNEDMESLVDNFLAIEQNSNKIKLINNLSYLLSFIRINDLMLYNLITKERGEKLNEILGKVIFDLIENADMRGLHNALSDM